MVTGRLSVGVYVLADSEVGKQARDLILLKPLDGLENAGLDARRGARLGETRGD